MTASRRWPVSVVLGAIVLFAIAIGAAMHTADFQDYGAAYLPGWQRTIDGADPWNGDAADYSYGPGFNLLAPLAAAHSLAPKLLFVGAWFVLAFLVARTWRGDVGATRTSVAWTWGWTLLAPIAWIEIPYFGHFDVLLALCIVLAVAAVRAGHSGRAGLLLGLGALVKFYPALAVLVLGLRARGDDARSWRSVSIDARLCGVFALTFGGGMAAAFAVWGTSVFAPLLFAAERHSKHLSIFRALRGSVGPGLDLDALAPAVVLVAVAATLVITWRRRTPTVHRLFAVLLALFTAYPAGHVQYLLVLLCLVPLLELERRTLALPGRALHAALAFYFGWVTLYHVGYFFLARYREEPWSVMRDVGGFVTLPLAILLWVVVVRGRGGDFARDRERLLDLGVFAIAATLLFAGLGSPSLHGEDEARYALAARGVLETGDWITLRVDGEPWFNKAPLRVWLTAVLGESSGLDAAAVRTPSALFALGAVVMTALIGRLLFDRRTGRLAALALITQLGVLFVHCGRGGEMDAGVLFGWCTLAYATLRARDDARWLLLGGLAVGTIALLKHAVVAAPALVFLVGGAWLVRDARTWSTRWLLAAIALAIAVALPWHLLAWRANGAAFVDDYFGREVAGRMGGEIVAAHSPLFAWVRAKDLFAPWSLLLPFVLLARPRASERVPRVAAWMLLWVAAVIGVMSAARLGLPWYVIPAAPVVALVVARGLLAPRAGRRTRAGLDLAAAALVATSPLAAWRLAPFDGPAMTLPIRTDLIGALAGASVPWPQLGAALLLVVAAVLTGRATTAPGPRTTAVRLRVVTWSVLALAAAAWPVRTAYDARSDLDRLVDTMTADATVPPATACASVRTEPPVTESYVVRWSLARLGVEGVRFGASADAESTCWIFRSPPDADATLTVGAWSVTAPVEGH